MDYSRIDRKINFMRLIATAIIAATVWCVRLEMTTNDLKRDQERWKNGSEERREKTIERFEKIEKRLTIIETTLQCKGE